MISDNRIPLSVSPLNKASEGHHRRKKILLRFPPVAWERAVGV
jgi:hypothetical protein